MANNLKIYIPRITIPFRGLRVSPDGKVYYMIIDEKGLCILRYDPWQ